jgi:CO/xanthine dehydrogenase Mo-binding subunit
VPEYSVIGKRVPSIDGKAKTTGDAKFTIDLQLPGMLYGKILRSPHPHAKILHIDTEKAKGIRGIKAIITGADVPRVKFAVFADHPDTMDQYGIAIDKVRYIGER